MAGTAEAPHRHHQRLLDGAAGEDVVEQGESDGDDDGARCSVLLFVALSALGSIIFRCVLAAATVACAIVFALWLVEEVFVPAYSACGRSGARRCANHEGRQKRRERRAAIKPRLQGREYCGWKAQLRQWTLERCGGAF